MSEETPEQQLRKMIKEEINAALKNFKFEIEIPKQEKEEEKHEPKEELEDAACPECDSKIKRGSKHCPDCGTELEWHPANEQ